MLAGSFAKSANTFVCLLYLLCVQPRMCRPSVGRTKRVESCGRQGRACEYMGGPLDAPAVGQAVLRGRGGPVRRDRQLRAQHCAGRAAAHGGHLRRGCGCAAGRHQRAGCAIKASETCIVCSKLTFGVEVYSCLRHLSSAATCHWLSESQSVMSVRLEK